MAFLKISEIECLVFENLYDNFQIDERLMDFMKIVKVVVRILMHIK